MPEDELEEQKANEQEASKKAVDVAAKGALNYATGGVGGKAFDTAKKVPLVGKDIDKAEDKIAKGLNNRTNGKVGQVANKLNDSGALDAADSAMSLSNKSPKNKNNPKLNNNGKNILNNNRNIKKADTDSLNKNDNLKNKIDESKIKGSQAAFSESLARNLGSEEEQKEEEEKDNKDKKNSKNDTRNDNKKDDKSRNSRNNFAFKLSTKQVLIISAVILALVLFLGIFVVMIIIFNESLDNKNTTSLSDASMCSDISLVDTSLSSEEFKQKLEEYAASSNSAGARVFAEHADEIYEISKRNDFNPEMVMIRAVSEGFSPGGTSYNYWGLGCSNSGGGRDCQKFSSFDQGVLGFINNIKGHNYETLYQMMSKYAYIGDYWYNPGSSSKGGCYYYPYISKYLTTARSSMVSAACNTKPCSDSTCLKTNEEDQSAYAKYQSESMVNHREKIFGISATDCTQDSELVIDGKNVSGSELMNYAVDTFDNYRYSQSKRMEDGYVDCSSLPYRVYKHFGLTMGASTSGEEYRWCENNNKTISESELQPGDLIFYNTGQQKNTKNYKNIGHVEMYYGSGQIFGAHAAYSDYTRDVSITTYGNNGAYFCRPTK